MLQHLGEEVMDGSDDLAARGDVLETFEGERLLTPVDMVFFDAFLEDLLLLFVKLF